MSASSRLHFVDSLRGIAALYVILAHVLLLSQPNLQIPSEAIKTLATFGVTGVYLFFVISGFSLMLTWERHEQTGRPTFSYAVSRFFRIAPLFYVVLIFYLGRSIQNFQELADAAKNIALNVTFLFNLVPNHQDGIAWASWTIGVEMLFYAAFIPLRRLKFSPQLAIGVLSIGVFVLERVYLPPKYSLLSWIGYLPLFLLGMWAFQAYEMLRNSKRASLFGGLFTIGGLLVLAGCIYLPAELHNTWLRVPIGIGYAAVLIGCGLHPMALLKTSVLQWAGKISYSTYLLHPPIIFYLGSIFALIETHLPGPITYGACAVIAISLILPLAALTYRFIERAGEKLGRRIIRGETTRATASAESPAHAL